MKKVYVFVFTVCILCPLVLVGADSSTGESRDASIALSRLKAAPVSTDPWFTAEMTHIYRDAEYVGFFAAIMKSSSESLCRDKNPLGMSRALAILIKNDVINAEPQDLRKVLGKNMAIVEQAFAMKVVDTTRVAAIEKVRVLFGAKCNAQWHVVEGYGENTRGGFKDEADYLPRLTEFYDRDVTSMPYYIQLSKDSYEAGEPIVVWSCPESEKKKR